MTEKLQKYILGFIWRTCCADLYFPKSFAAGCRCGRLPAGGSKKNILLLPVIVTREELLLLRVKQPHYIALQLHTHQYKDMHTHSQKFYLAQIF